MAKENGIYKCEICGNVVSVIEAHQGELVCCGQPMDLLEEQGLEKEGKEKHVPIIEINGNDVVVKVGSVEHPMEEGHHIQLIQLIKEDKIVMGKRLKPGDKPEVNFYVDDVNGLKARALCNIHGLWRS